MKITRKETNPKPMFTEKDLSDQYAELLAYRAVKEYRKDLPLFDASKCYVCYYRVMKQDGKEQRIRSLSFATIKEAITAYQGEGYFSTSFKDCYYIKILCVRKDVPSFIRGEDACIVTVLESEAIER